MQKKMVGILAGVAAAHAVLLVGMITGGGCRQPEILGPHTYNNGPEFSEVPAATPAPAPAVAPTVPKAGTDAPLPPPPEVKPAAADWNEPLPPPIAAPVKAQSPVGTTTYKVKKGDSLSKIAFKHGVSLSALAACNNLSGKAMNTLRVGQTLNIPEGGVYNPDRVMKKRSTAVKSAKNAKKTVKKAAKSKATKAALPADGVHVVKSGDTLDRIGRRYGVSGKAIAKENNIAVNKVLHIGDKLRIPGKMSAAAPAAVAPEAPVPTAAPATAETVANKDLVDSLDPNLGMDNASTAAPAPAADNAAAPATGSAAAPAAAGTTAPAAASTAGQQKTEIFEIHNDVTVEDFSRQLAIPVDQLRQLNKDLPADGKLKAGSYVVIPSF